MEVVITNYYVIIVQPHNEVIMDRKHLKLLTVVEVAVKAWTIIYVYIESK